LKKRCHDYGYKLLALLFGLLTIIILWSEVMIYSRVNVLSPIFSLATAKTNTHVEKSLMIESFVLLPYFYMTIAACFALVHLRLVSLFGSVFYLVESCRATDPQSLLYHASWACAIIAPMGNNMLGIATPHRDSTSVNESSFSKTFPVALLSFQDFFPPVTLLLLVLFFLLHGFKQIKAKWFGLDDHSFNDTGHSFPFHAKRHVRPQPHFRFALSRIKNRYNWQRHQEERIEETFSATEAPSA